MKFFFVFVEKTEKNLNRFFFIFFFLLPSFF